MSKVAKKPVAIPSGVEVKIGAEQFSVKGPKGELTRPLPKGITIEIADGEGVVKRQNDEQKVIMLHGTIRSHLANMVKGVSEGFEKTLVLEGVGYRASSTANGIQLALGFSHPVDYAVRKGVDVKTPEPTKIIISGINPEAVGQVAAEIKSFRPPEPYKGKGIRYENERVRRKAGKAAAK